MKAKMFIVLMLVLFIGFPLSQSYAKKQIQTTTKAEVLGYYDIKTGDFEQNDHKASYSVGKTLRKFFGLCGGAVSVSKNCLMKCDGSPSGNEGSDTTCLKTCKCSETEDDNCNVNTNVSNNCVACFGVCGDVVVVPE